MNFHYLKHEQIDKAKWDECIENSFNHLPYAYSWYLDCVSPGWHAFADEKYDFVFPLTLRRKAGISYLFQPYFTQQLGLFSKKKFSSSDLKEFLKVISEKFLFVEINLNTACIFSDDNLKKKLTHHLSLKKSYDEISKTFNENARRNIRKSEKNNFILQATEDSKTLIKIFRNETGKKTSLKPQDYKLLDNLIQTAIKNGKGKIFNVLSENKKTVSGMLLVESETMLINLFNCGYSEEKKKGAMYFLFNEVIKMNADSGKIFDFEGSEIPEVARFYKGFGGMPVFYPSFRLNQLHWSLKWLKK